MFNLFFHKDIIIRLWNNLESNRWFTYLVCGDTNKSERVFVSFLVLALSEVEGGEKRRKKIKIEIYKDFNLRKGFIRFDYLIIFFIKFVKD